MKKSKQNYTSEFKSKMVMELLRGEKALNKLEGQYRCGCVYPRHRISVADEYPEGKHQHRGECQKKQQTPWIIRFFVLCCSVKEIHAPSSPQLRYSIYNFTSLSPNTSTSAASAADAFASDTV